MIENHVSCQAVNGYLVKDVTFNSENLSPWFLQLPITSTPMEMKMEMVWVLM